MLANAILNSLSDEPTVSGAEIVQALHEGKITEDVLHMLRDSVENNILDATQVDEKDEEKLEDINDIAE